MLIARSRELIVSSCASEIISTIGVIRELYDQLIVPVDDIFFIFVFVRRSCAVSPVLVPADGAALYTIAGAEELHPPPPPPGHVDD